MDLTKKHCIPCEGGTPPLTADQEDELMKQVSDWELVRDGEHRIIRKFKFTDFKESLAFVNKVGELAEREDHHPNIKINYSRVELELYTHSIGGLSENDFIMAAKIDILL